MGDISPGTRVIVTTAGGGTSARRAVSGVESGDRFPIVWVCEEEEWQAAQASGREPDAIPWPADYVRVEQEPAKEA